MFVRMRRAFMTPPQVRVLLSSGPGERRRTEKRMTPGNARFETARMTHECILITLRRRLCSPYSTDLVLVKPRDNTYLRTYRSPSLCCS
uniref:Secreted protein n=1 Tax=Steinernema glaseri TaxID=37863 RepID=A0A1I7XYJ6_9BILA